MPSIHIGKNPIFPIMFNDVFVLLEIKVFAFTTNKLQNLFYTWFSCFYLPINQNAIHGEIMPFLAALAISSIVIPTSLPATNEASILTKQNILGPLVTEIVIHCTSLSVKGKGYGIISFSRVDHEYCTPTNLCFSSLSLARNETCNF